MRTTGDRIDSKDVKALRERRGWTQEELARQMGIRGGKGVVSAWESGKAPCEGPAAELLLRLAGFNDTDAEYMSQQNIVHDVWTRARPLVTEPWRQFSAISKAALSLDADGFMSLFPEVAIPGTQYAHGFPFIADGLPPEVFGIGQKGWSGSIPVEEDEPPSYFWLLQRTGSFVYREALWETDTMSVTSGHIHIGALLTLALAGTYFLRKLVDHLGLASETAFVLRLHLAGIRGRGVVTYNEHAPIEVGLLASPQLVASSEEFWVATEVSAGQLTEQPKEMGIALVQELLRSLSPKMASRERLERQLAIQYAHDVERGSKYRWLGFLDEKEDEFESARRELQTAYQEYRAGLAAYAAATGPAKQAAWQAIAAKLDELKNRAERLKSLGGKRPSAR